MVLDRKEKKQFAFLTGLDIVISILDILSLVLLLWIIRFYVQPGQDNRFADLPGWLANRSSVLLIAIFFLLFGIKNAAGFLITKAQYRFISRVAVRISGNNLLRYQNAEFGDFINIDSSVQIRRIGFQPFEFCQYVLSGIQQIITQTCLILIAVTAIILFNARLFILLVCILLPPVIVVFYYIRKKLAAARWQVQAGNEKSFQYLLDALKGYVEGNIYNRNGFFRQRFILYRKKFSSCLFDSLSIQSMPNRVIEIFAVLGLLMLIAIAKWSGNNDQTSFITIGAFMAAAYKIIPGIVKLVNTGGQIKSYGFSLSDLKTGTGEAGRGEEPSGGICSVQFRNISFQYAGLPVLRDFYLQTKRGELVGITGRSGKGKTTIFNLLLGFLSPDTGEILINDRPAGKDDLKKYWPSISYVRQQSFLIHDTILQNITLEEKDHNEGRLQRALSVSGLDELIAQFPEGLGKIVTENGKNISGGQQQRIALARALYKEADVFLLDEPFNELDEASEISLLGHFRELSARGKLVIMITHDQKSLSYCNQIISLDEQ
jgi:ABC-type bacteriocin/lantibiotic exporter with double-glycine peptidase domain